MSLSLNKLLLRSNILVQLSSIVELSYTWFALIVFYHGFCLCLKSLIAVYQLVWIWTNVEASSKRRKLNVKTNKQQAKQQYIQQCTK